MVTPLHIEIAMHYHCRVGQHPMLHNRIHRAYAEDLVATGLLRRSSGLATGGYAKTGAFAIWIEAICHTPFPDQTSAVSNASDRLAPPQSREPHDGKEDAR